MSEYDYQNGFLEGMAWAEAGEIIGEIWGFCIVLLVIEFLLKIAFMITLVVLFVLLILSSIHSVQKFKQGKELIKSNYAIGPITIVGCIKNFILCDVQDPKPILSGRRKCNLPRKYNRLWYFGNILAGVVMSPYALYKYIKWRKENRENLYFTAGIERDVQEYLNNRPEPFYYSKGAFIALWAIVASPLYKRILYRILFLFASSILTPIFLCIRIAWTIVIFCAINMLYKYYIKLDMVQTYNEIAIISTRTAELYPNSGYKKVDPVEIYR